MSWRTVMISNQSKLDYKMGYMFIRGEEITWNRSPNTTVKNCSSPWIYARSSPMNR